MRQKMPSEVKEKFATYPPSARKKLLALRQLILTVAAQTPGVGPLEETLKWGEPSFVTTQSKSGSTIRIDWKAKTPEHYALYLNCKTTLIDSFKEQCGDNFTYVGNRSIVFGIDEVIDEELLADCIAMALTYHLTKRKKS